MALLLSILGQLEAITVDTMSKVSNLFAAVSVDGSLVNRGRRRNAAAEEGVNAVAENVADLAARNQQMATTVDGDVVEEEVRNSAQNIRTLCA